jgi:uncharacterized glyoxalase superfamily protein PhnB
MPAYINLNRALMPNLDNLKKQAKLYVRWHRDAYYPVAARIRAALPRFAAMSDREVLAAEFKLADAQELVAKEAGFESWAALRKDIATMTEASELRPATLIAAEPQLCVTDIPAAIAFYAQVVRDGARLNLRHVDAPPRDPAVRDEDHVLSATITLADAKPLFLEYQAAGVAFAHTLRSEPWGARTFMIRDPEGNLLLFAGQTGG